MLQKPQRGSLSEHAQASRIPSCRLWALCGDRKLFETSKFNNADASPPSHRHGERLLNPHSPGSFGTCRRGTVNDFVRERCRRTRNAARRISRHVAMPAPNCSQDCDCPGRTDQRR
jgi:hypothetical protein